MVQVSITALFHFAAEHAATILQKVELPVIQNSICSAWYQAQGKHVMVSNTQFCAGYALGGKDACRVCTLFYIISYIMPSSYHYHWW